MSDIQTPSLALPAKEEKACKLEIQREFMGLYKIEPVDESQCLYRGKLIPPSRSGQFASISERDWVYFSRKSDPENNDLDKVFVEEHYTDEITGYAFTLVPGNKIRMFYVPEGSIIKLAPGSNKSILL